MKAASAVATLLFAANAYAVSPSQLACEEAGGSYSHEQGISMCVASSSENVGNSPNSQTTTTTTTSAGQGNTQNKNQTSSECSGPGNSGAGSSHCN